MTSTRAVAYIGGASLMLAWLAAASGEPQRPRPVRDAPPREDAQVLQLRTVKPDGTVLEPPRMIRIEDF